MLACIGLFAFQSQAAKNLPVQPGFDEQLLAAVTDPTKGPQVVQALPEMKSILKQQAEAEQQQLEYTEPNYGAMDPETAYWLREHDRMIEKLTSDTVQVAEVGYGAMTAQSAFHSLSLLGLGLMALAGVVAVGIAIIKMGGK